MENLRIFKLKLYFALVENIHRHFIFTCKIIFDNLLVLFALASIIPPRIDFQLICIDFIIESISFIQLSKMIYIRKTD